MGNTSKRMKKAISIAKDLQKSYTLEEAVELLLKMPKVNFDETIEVAVRLGVDARQSNQIVRGTVLLPNGSGKQIRILVFTEKPKDSLEAGADFAGLEDIITKIEEGWMNFDIALATSQAMKKVRNIARILGPKGLMPNLKSGTVTDDIASGVQAIKSGRLEFKMDKTSNVHIAVGKRSFSAEKIIENINNFINALKQAKPESFNGSYLKNFSISSTMSPGIKINIKNHIKF